MRHLIDKLEEAAKPSKHRGSQFSERVGAALGMYWALQERLQGLRVSSVSFEPGLPFADKLMTDARHAIDLLGNEIARLRVGSDESDFEEKAKSAAQRVYKTIGRL